jgi:hypothetical protein
VLVDYLINFFLELFFLFVLGIEDVLEGIVIALFLIFNRKFLLELFPFLVEIAIALFFLGILSIASYDEGFSHQFLHFVIKIFFSWILQHI